MAFRETSDRAMITWWANIRDNGGLRLTRHGYEILHDILKLESWQLDLSAQPPQILDKRLLLEMDRKLQWPYYFDVNTRRQRRHLVFFSSREAMMATMYGDLKKWLQNLERNDDHG